MNIQKIILFLIGLALVTFAIVPTPDDVTVVSPVIIFSAGAGFIAKSLEDQK